MRFSATMRYVTSPGARRSSSRVRARSLVTDDNGRERERTRFLTATLRRSTTEPGQGRRQLARRGIRTPPDRHRIRRVGEVRERRKGVTVDKQMDEVTGLSTLVVIDPKRGGKAGKDPVPRSSDGPRTAKVKIHGTDHSVHDHLPQVGSLITVKDRQPVAVGDDHRASRRESVEDPRHHGRSAARGRTVRGPRAEGCRRLAEVTAPCRSARTKGKQRLVITEPDGTAPHEFPDPGTSMSAAHDGQVEQGRPSVIVDGPADPHDILRLGGGAGPYIIDEVQDVYRLRGVKINDKHIEVIVRQMLRRVVITDPAIHPSREGRSNVPKCWTRTTR